MLRRTKSKAQHNFKAFSFQFLQSSDRECTDRKRVFLNGKSKD